MSQRSILKESSNKMLNNHLYIESFSEKENSVMADQTRKSTLYEQQRKIIDLEQQNFKLRQAVMLSQQQQPTQSRELIQKQFKMRLESVTRQYELKMEKQEEMHKLEIWKLKEDIETLNFQLRSGNNHMATFASEQQQQMNHDHCPLCSDGQVLERMCKMYNDLEDDHKGCLNLRKESVIKMVELQHSISDLKGQLLKMEGELKMARTRQIQAQNKCTQLNQQKNELDSNNIRLIQENARLRLREDQLKIREEHIKLREQETTRSIARSQTMKELSVNIPQPPPSTKSSIPHSLLGQLPMKGSIIDRLHQDYRKPGSSKTNTTVSFDLRQHESSERHRPPSSAKMRIALEHTKLHDRPSFTGIMASSSSNHGMDTFRPQRKPANAYRYNIS